jgi:hypothetical protein
MYFVSLRRLLAMFSCSSLARVAAQKIAPKIWERLDSSSDLDGLNVGGLWAFAVLTGFNFEAHALALFQVAVTGTRDGAEVNEHVWVALVCDEAEPFFAVEPFDCTFWHFVLLCDFVCC